MAVEIKHFYNDGLHDGLVFLHYYWTRRIKKEFIAANARIAMKVISLLDFMACSGNIDCEIFSSLSHEISEDRAIYSFFLSKNRKSDFL